MKQNLMKIAAIGFLAAGLGLGQTATTTPAAGARKGQGIRAVLQKRMMQSLNLTDAQKQQIKTIRQGARQTAQPVAQELKQNRQALAAAVQAGDSVKIQQLSTLIGQEQGQVLAIRSDAMSKVVAVLTPDQKAKMAAFRQKAQDLLGKRAGK